MKTDYLIVGSGLTGAVIARTLADAGRDVLVLDRRTHLGGNVHDSDHPSGIRVHTYGPHYFRTSSPAIWDFVTRFAHFYEYEARVQSLVDGRSEPWPLSRDAIRRLAGPRWQPGFTGTPSNFEEASLAMMPRSIYDKFVKPYTEKQWAVPAAALSASLARRFNVRRDDDPRLTSHKYQGLPLEGYATLMRNMLAGIPVLVGRDYLREHPAFTYRKMLIFTGPIDEYFAFDLGRLHYRGQRRAHTYIPDADFAQPCAQLNNPDPANGPHIRTIEWKHLLPPERRPAVAGTVLTRETPYSPRDPGAYEYPMPDRANARLYQQYHRRAQSLDNVLICGRLGEYRYLDMDQAIARARTLATQVLARDTAIRRLEPVELSRVA